MADIKVALVGFGEAGRQHLQALGGTVGACPVAVVEDDREAVAVARSAGLETRDMDQVLADESIRLVALCRPPEHRRPWIRPLMAAGKHLILEAPPAQSAHELCEVLFLTERAQVLAGVMSHHRFTLPKDIWHGDPHRFAGAEAKLLVSRPTGVHYLDLACQILGTPREVRTLPAGAAAPAAGVEVAASIRFESGAHLTLTVTSPTSPDDERLLVRGATDWIDVRAGAVSGEVAGVPFSRPARPAMLLRTAVYQEITDAVRGERRLDLAGLSRSTGVMRVLDALSPEGCA
ncbi:Gfo/Idh/MocA family oxidoreductase [Streptomyces sp. NPDC051214]|uniref:Gfo/Idh/MocA family protein n=1 Tax=Streptomyces sp. NPDC051214 TaxID=3155282 RepID=UPI00342EA82B